MTYHHIVRPAQDGDARTLVLLHGTGGNEREFLPLGELVAPTAALVALRGDVDENGMARFFRRRAEGLYDMADLAERTAALRAFLAQRLAELGRDPARAVGIGYSNGANILANLAFTAPATLGGYALLHPLVPFAPPPQAGLARVPVLLTSGMHDPIAPAAQAMALERYFAEAGARVEHHRHAGGHELRSEELAALARFLEAFRVSAAPAA